MNQKRYDLWYKRCGTHHAYTCTTVDMVANILAVYDKATDSERRFNWYQDAHEFARYLADTYEFSIEAAAGIISALSPQNKWERNKVDAESVCAALFLKLKVYNLSVSTYNANKWKAAEIAYELRHGSADEVETVFAGYKTRSFYRNIADPTDPHTVTVDFHAYSIAVGKRYTATNVPSMGAADYDKVANAYRIASNILGVLPSKVQAVTWVTWRNRNHNQLNLFEATA